jgi:hypothetical protein
MALAINCNGGDCRQANAIIESAVSARKLQELNGFSAVSS